MAKDRVIVYEPHPVSPERKRELLAQGFKIIDSVFAPKNVLREDGPTVTEFVEAGYLATDYPPRGYASRSSDSEIAAAIAAQSYAGNHAQDLDAAEGTQTDIPPVAPANDGLDDLEVEHLRALAKERGISVHHNAGADKVREALRQAAKD